VVVDDRHRGAGIGHALLDRAEQIAQQSGCEEMEITSSRNRDQGPSVLQIPRLRRLVRDLGTFPEATQPRVGL
jgi:GNAT superfamily N-acetyltransferase